jgi:broad specificity phosphatase PhoE
MDDIALARHAESVSAANGLVGGDTPLTSCGREEAQTLGERLRGFAIDVCVTSRARRTYETAAIALDGRNVPIAIEEDLGEIRFGAFEGRPLAEYRAWVEAHRPDEAPAGGESRVETLRRFVRGFRTVLARPERSALVVAHGLTLRSVVDPIPQPIVAGTPYGGYVVLSCVELAHAVNRLERWCDAATW